MATLKSQSNSTSKPIRPIRVQTFRFLFNIFSKLQTVYTCDYLIQLGRRVSVDLVRDVLSQQCQLQSIVPAHHMAVCLRIKSEGLIQQC